MANNEVRCGACGLLESQPEADTCPSCDASFPGPGKASLARVERRSQWEDLQALSEKLEGERSDVQFIVDTLTAASLTMTERDDPHCPVIGHFLRVLGRRMTAVCADLFELETHVRKVAPELPGCKLDYLLADQLGTLADSMTAKRRRCHQWPKWEVRLEYVDPSINRPLRTVVVSATEPRIAREKALQIAAHRWPGPKLMVVSVVPKFD